MFQVSHVQTHNMAMNFFQVLNERLRPILFNIKRSTISVANGQWGIKRGIKRRGIKRKELLCLIELNEGAFGNVW